MKNYSNKNTKVCNKIITLSSSNNNNNNNNNNDKDNCIELVATRPGGYNSLPTRTHDSNCHQVLVMQDVRKTRSVFVQDTFAEMNLLNKRKRK